MSAYPYKKNFLQETYSLTLTAFSRLRDEMAVLLPTVKNPWLGIAEYGSIWNKRYYVITLP